MLQYLKSLLCEILMAFWLFFLGIIGIIPALFSRRWARYFIKIYCKGLLFLLRIICGLTYEIRGSLPQYPAVIASKHQSFFDTIIHCHVLGSTGFVIKKQLNYIPFFGFFLRRTGSIAIDRKVKSMPTRDLVANIANSSDVCRYLIVYPEGTRVKPGDSVPYKKGVAVMAKHLSWQCVPAATNVGIYWGNSIMRKPGVAVMQYLPPIDTSASIRDMCVEIEQTIEENSNRLMAEAGFKGTKNLKK